MTPQPSSTGLPVERVVSDLRGYLAGVGRAVLVAEPGAGKSTVVPLRLLEEAWLSGGNIVVLEPRRVAARSVARRMAYLLGSTVGDVVGYRTRDDSKVSAATRIEVVTEGILTRRIQTDPELRGVGLIIFDEFHERSVHADMGLAFTLEVMETVREDLRLLVMSATIDAAKVAALIGASEPAPIVSCTGRTFPVDIRWRPRRERQRLEDATTAAVDVALKEQGDVLVFMPGIAEIRRVVEELSKRHREVLALPLYGGLDALAQDEALTYNPNRRRVIVSTDVAETSLTVEGIGVVVDAGVARRPRYDPATGLSKLVTIEHSRSSADQRAGRAGRLGPGVAIRLWSKSQQAARRKHEQPEITTIDLASVVLEAAAWGARRVQDLKLLDIPAAAAIEEAENILFLLGALGSNGRISRAGRAMLRLPLPPRLAAMVSASADGPMGWSACLLAALLSERDVIGGRPATRPADMWTRVELAQDQGRSFPSADGRAIRLVRSRANDIARRVGVSRTAVSPADIGRTLALAYPDRLAQNRGGKGGRFRLRNGIGASVAADDPLALEPTIVVAEIAGEKRNPLIRRAAGIDSIDIELGFHDEIVERHFFGWDDDRNDLSQRVERRLGALDFGVVEESIDASPEVTAALIERLVADDLTLLKWSEGAKALQARCAFVAEHCPAENFADLSNEVLRNNAEKVFGPWLLDATGRADLERLDLAQIFMSLLGWEGERRLAELAPLTFCLPSGREISIDYSKSTPLVSLRVQEVFGLTEGPRLAAGAVPLTFELLSPAQRPIQTTSDLAGFWGGSWLEVRKDMAGRYPKHEWPERPDRIQ